MSWLHVHPARRFRWVYQVFGWLALGVLGLGLAACPAEPLIPGEIPSEAIGLMVRVEEFEIDATEVTRDQYREFLLSQPALSRDQDCDWNLTYDPACLWMEEERGDLPATCLNWCHARDYCEWAGKRLCEGDFNRPDEDEWYRACIGPEGLAYPYADSYSAYSCNGYDAGLNRAAPVGQFPGCVGGYAELYDMSGNVFEWTAACGPGFGPKVYCRLRGGAYRSDPDVLRCDANLGKETNRDMANPMIGFRCCR